MKKLLLLTLLLGCCLLSSAEKVHAAGTVVQFGDSLTQGMLQFGGLVDQYKTAGFTAIVPGDNGSHGFFGKSISSVLGSVDASTSDIKSATAIVVELGTNPGGTGQANTIQSDMGQMIDKLKGINPVAKIYWVNLVVIQPANAIEYSARNKAIASVAAAKGATVIDWYRKVFPSGDPTNMQSVTSDPNGWIIDKDLGIHLSSVGYQTMSQTIISVVATGGAAASPAINGPLNGTTISNSSDCVVTKIGSPQASPVPPPWCQAQGSSDANLASILDWDSKINAALEKGAMWGYYNRLETDITNGTFHATQEPGTSTTSLYWCTYSIADAFNLAGVKGLSITADGMVVNMEKHFGELPGFTHYDYPQHEQDVLTKVQPGFVLFMWDDSVNAHVALIKSKSISPQGNGSLTTYESNGPDKIGTYTIKDWHITDAIHAVKGVGTVQVKGQGPQSSDVFGSLPGTVSALAVLPNGQQISKNATKAQPSYSVIKLWVAGATYDAAKNNQLNLNDTYTVTSKDVAPGTGVLNQPGVLPKTLSYDDLVGLMLIHSDNTATNMLINKLGGFSGVNSYISANGYPQTVVRRYLGATDTTNENLTSASDAVLFMQRLYNNQIVNSNYSVKIKQFLDQRRTEELPQFIYLGRKLPSGSYDEKSGDGTGVRNDAGTITTKSGQRAFVAILLSNLSDEVGGENAIADAALNIYNSN